jgi:MraZ protein
MAESKHTIKLESFIGKATVAIDAAGRTNFPKDFRKVLRDDGEGKTLALFPLYAWNDYVVYLENLGRGVDNSKFRTRITSMAKLSVLDGQNRITLTAEQMAYAGISGEVTFVGDGKKVRLWAPERFSQQVGAITADEEKLFENLF